MTSPLLPFVLPDIREEDIDAATKVLRSGYLNEGPVTRQLEDEFAAFTGAKHAIATTSGTAALMLAVRAVRNKKTSGIYYIEEPAWRTYISDHTFYGTASAARLAGEDVGLYDDGSMCRFTRDANDIVTRVYISGRMANPALEKFMVDDCCHALGSYIGGPKCHAGRLSTAGCFSFQSEKLIGIGQGGMVITDHDDIAARIRELKNQGCIGAKNPRGGDIHPTIGFNFRMTDYQAALALGQLRRIREKIQEKWDAWAVWLSDLGKIPEAVEIAPRAHGEMPLWTDILLPSLAKREAAISLLWEAGIECRRFYPPLHRHPPFKGRDADFPASASLSERGIWLPNNRLVTPEIAHCTAGILNGINAL